MERDGEDLVTSASVIGEVRPQDTLVAAAGDADVGDVDTKNAADGGESPLLISRSGKTSGQRSHKKTAVDSTDEKPDSPVQSSQSGNFDDSNAISGVHDEPDTTGLDTQSALPCENTTRRASGTETEDSSHEHVASTEQLHVAHALDSGVVDTEDSAISTPSESAAIGDSRPGHVTPIQPSTPTPVDTVDVSAEGCQPSTPKKEQMPVAGPILTSTPMSKVAVTPSTGSAWSTPRGITVSCEVVDISSQDLSEDIETADEAEADIMTQVASESASLPPIDGALLHDLERQARFVSDDLNLLIGSMTSNLNAMSTVSLRCMEAYKESIDDLGVNVDESIKSMYLLIAKCEAIGNDMKPIYNLADQIKSIKQTLAIFEQLCKP